MRERKTKRFVYNPVSIVETCTYHFHISNVVALMKIAVWLVIIKEWTFEGLFGGRLLIQSLRRGWNSVIHALIIGKGRMM